MGSRVTHDPKQAWPAVRGLMNVKEDVVGNYPTFVKRIAEVVEHGYWREFYFEPLGKTKTFETLDQFLEWVRIDERELIALLQAHNEDALLARVRAELGGELAEHGEIGNGRKSRDSDATSTDDRSATYVVARLNRDRPDLAERVMAGDISPNAAAVEAGFRKRYIRVPAGDVRGAVSKLLSEFSRDELIAALRSA